MSIDYDDERGKELRTKIHNVLSYWKNVDYMTKRTRFWLGATDTDVNLILLNVATVEQLARSLKATVEEIENRTFREERNEG